MADGAVESIDILDPSSEPTQTTSSDNIYQTSAASLWCSSTNIWWRHGMAWRATWSTKCMPPVPYPPTQHSTVLQLTKPCQFWAKVIFITSFAVAESNRNFQFSNCHLPWLTDFINRMCSSAPIPPSFAIENVLDRMHIAGISHLVIVSEHCRTLCGLAFVMQ